MSAGVIGGIGPRWNLALPKGGCFFFVSVCSRSGFAGAFSMLVNAWVAHDSPSARACGMVRWKWVRHTVRRLACRGVISRMMVRPGSKECANRGQY